MKILFLDVDGVLNTTSTPSDQNIEPRLMQNLVKIVKATGVKIVLSSDWRLLDEWKQNLSEIFEEFGSEKWIDSTDFLDGRSRSYEISKWLSENVSLGIVRFAILDDYPDAGYGFEDNFFQTSTAKGLTDDITDRIISFLGENK